jgi:hypothetical protein
MYLARPVFGSFGSFGADDPMAISPVIVAAAQKWGAARGLPVPWILATIWAESRGNPRAVGDYHVDPKGASIGLMQVNTVAEASNLKRARTTREMLFNPDKNIEWGSMILLRKYQLVLQALAKAKNRKVATAIAKRPELLGELVRLLYTGVDVIRHIYRGTLPDPKKVAHTVGGWRRNLVAVAPLTTPDAAA